MARGVQRGETSPTTAILKMSKAFERVEAEKVLLEKDLEKRWAAEELVKQPGGVISGRGSLRANCLTKSIRKIMLRSYRRERTQRRKGVLGKSVLRVQKGRSKHQIL